MPRCPNGTRKNNKTGLCEPKKTEEELKREKKEKKAKKVKTVKEPKAKKEKTVKEPKAKKEKTKKVISNESINQIDLNGLPKTVRVRRFNPFLRANKLKKKTKKNKLQMEIEKKKLLIEYIDHQSQQLTNAEPLSINGYEYKLEEKNGHKLLMGKKKNSTEWLIVSQLS